MTATTTGTATGHSAVRKATARRTSGVHSTAADASATHADVPERATLLEMHAAHRTRGQLTVMRRGYRRTVMGRRVNGAVSRHRRAVVHRRTDGAMH